MLPTTGVVTGVCESLGVPVIVKPSVSSGSFGIGLRSVVRTNEAVAARRDELRTGELGRWYAHDTIFCERFIEGPEYTVFIMGGGDDPASLKHLTPAERVFHHEIPVAERFLSYDRYWGLFREESAPSDGESFYGYVRAPADVAPALVDIARRAYRAMGGTGYARVDLRGDRATGEVHVLEVNANCALSSDGETSVGQILRLDGMTFATLLAEILESALRDRDGYVGSVEP